MLIFEESVAGTLFLLSFFCNLIAVFDHSKAGVRFASFP